MSGEESLLQIDIMRIYRVPLLGLVASMKIKDVKSEVEMCVNDTLKITSKDKKHQIILKVESMIKLDEGIIID